MQHTFMAQKSLRSLVLAWALVVFTVCSDHLKRGGGLFNR